MVLGVVLIAKPNWGCMVCITQVVHGMHYLRALRCKVPSSRVQGLALFSGKQCMICIDWLCTMCTRFANVKRSSVYIHGCMYIQIFRGGGDCPPPSMLAGPRESRVFPITIKRGHATRVHECVGSRLACWFWPVYSCIGFSWP